MEAVLLDGVLIAFLVPVPAEDIKADEPQFPLFSFTDELDSRLRQTAAPIGLVSVVIVCQCKTKRF